MDLVMKLPQNIWKTFTLLINMAKSLKLLISPSSKSITAGELVYTSQNSSSPEVMEEIGKAVAEGNLQKVIGIVKDEMQSKSKYTVKIAVTGDSGNGMSSFINALRLIGHDEEDSAPTGVVRTTQKPARYSSSHFPYVDLWDLPGLGATAQSVKSYLEEMQISTFDLIIIIASEQFSSNHVKLAEAMQRMRKRFYVVWTKLDRDLRTSTFPEPQLLQNIQKNIQENLQQAQVREPPVFLVSCFSPSLHDFPKLRETLQKDLTVIKHLDLLETLSHICEKNINDRVESIKRSIDADSLQRESEISDPDNMKEIQKVFQEIFGVDDESLRQVALKMGRPDTHFTSREFQEKLSNQQNDWTKWLYQSATQFVSKPYNFMKCCYHRHHSRHMQQKGILDETAGKAKAVLLEILKDSIPHP
ncbi:immunity-related GTPase family M protein 1-like isoform X2 [Mastomys coucha]|uniref:immunity-related GTPase family M protein 1-like isoform X2 n=1 Tax=Mastomys coucha TaxID=35658 RepID=UPI001261BC25|nr:immunity-related GTPase family M protein 1-like isoform X2 [Mastomys coucha]